MRLNPLKAKLDAGETVFGTFVSMPEPGIVEAIGYAGYDFVILDMEHSPIGFAELRLLLAAADGAGVTAVVRVGGGAANPILRVLDSGAAGVMAPHVESRADAEALVRACRYPPEGIRGVSGASRAAGYGRDPFREHVARANRDVLTIALIEDRAGVEAIEEIVAVPGLNIVCPGAGDLSASLGHIGEPQHPEVQAQMEHAARVIRATPGLVLGLHVMDPSQVGRCRELGAQFIIFSQDSRILYQSLRGALEALREG